MKLKHLIFGIGWLLLLSRISAQTNHFDVIGYAFPNLPPEMRSNIVVLLDVSNDDPPISKSCPPAYTNLLTNTNLFSGSEVQRIKEVILKYKNVTTNSGPAGTLFKEWKMKQWKITDQFIETIPVAVFIYTNSSDSEEVGSIFGDIQTVAHFRTPSEDGYDVLIEHGRLMRLMEYKNGVLDGLDVFTNDTAKPNDKYDRCTLHLRFSKGKAVGKYIVWDEGGKISCEWEFKKPFDILKYSSAKWDLSWTDKGVAH